MNNAPEGLDYGTTNTAHKHDCADMLEQHLEAGKYATGATPAPEHERAGLLRMLGKGSEDPIYHNTKKNK